jgi:hypothetical protein
VTSRGPPRTARAKTNVRMIRRLLRPLTRSFAAAASPKPTHDTHHHADTHAASHHQRGSGEHHDHDHEHHEHHDHDQVDPEAFAKLPYAEQVRIYNEALSKQIRFGHPVRGCEFVRISI